MVVFQKLCGLAWFSRVHKKCLLTAHHVYSIGILVSPADGRDFDEMKLFEKVTGVRRS